MIPSRMSWALLLFLAVARIYAASHAHVGEVKVPPPAIAMDLSIDLGGTMCHISPNLVSTTAHGLVVRDARVVLDERDTLLGPFHLMPKTNEVWSLAIGTKLLLRRERGQWNYAGGDTLEHLEPIQMSIGTSVPALWDSIFLRVSGSVLQARLCSRLEEPTWNGAFVYNPGRRVQGNENLGSPDSLLLSPLNGVGASDRALPDSLAFQWLDKDGAPLAKAAVLAWDTASILRARCGWLDGGIRLNSREGLKIIWLVQRGTSDTLSLETKDNSNWDVSRPGWTLGQGITTSDGWTIRDSALRFFWYQNYSKPQGPVFLPEPTSLRWSRDGIEWRYMESPFYARRTVQMKRLGSPGLLGASADWQASRFPLPDDAFLLAGSARAHWTHGLRWQSPDTLVASAKFLAGPGLPDSLWKRFPDVDLRIAVHLEGDRHVFQMPADGAFCSAPQSFLDLGTLGTITTSQSNMILVGDSRGLRIEALSRKRHRSIEESDSTDTLLHNGGPLVLTGNPSGSRRAISAATLLPRVALTACAKPNILTRQGGITFSVDDVEPNRTPKPKLSLEKWKEEISFGREQWISGNLGSDSLIEGSTYGNAFLDAFVTAWNEHRPVRLSPDAVWMALLGSLTTRVTNNAETCRSDLVAFQGKKTIEIEVSQQIASRLDEESSWDWIADQLLAKLHPKIKWGRDAALRPVFSTTTPSRAMAVRLKILELYSPFFDYIGGVGCGIPSITLEGTPADWKKLKGRLSHLGLCGLEKWSKQMGPVLDQFIRTSEGYPDPGFWRSFVRYIPPDPECGASSYVDGWVTTFFPVDSKGHLTGFLHRLELGREPKGSGDFDFKLKEAGHVRNFKLRSGFSGIGQSPDGALFPELSWSAWEDTSATSREKRSSEGDDISD